MNLFFTWVTFYLLLKVGQHLFAQPVYVRIAQ